MAKTIRKLLDENDCTGDYAHLKIKIYDDGYLSIEAVTEQADSELIESGISIKELITFLEGFEEVNFE